MQNKNFVAIIVGIGLCGLLAILIAWMGMASSNPESTQDGKSLTPAVVTDEGYGTVRLPEAISRFEADGASGLVTIEAGKQAERLPVGQYHIRSWKIERKDDQGGAWALTGQYFGQNNPFEIKDGDETKLDVGEPIIATVDARNVGSSYSFNQVIKGRHDEVIELTRNGSRPQPPKLRIKNKDGTYDRTFSFRYG
jgi:hypothetical protein